MWRMLKAWPAALATKMVLAQHGMATRPSPKELETRGFRGKLGEIMARNGSKSLKIKQVGVSQRRDAIAHHDGHRWPRRPTSFSVRKVQKKP